MTISYSQLGIKPLDLEFILEFCRKRGYSIDDVDLSDLSYFNSMWQPEKIMNLDLTSFIIQELFTKAIDEKVEDENDAELLRASIYNNYLDSRFNIKEEELATEQARKFLLDFHS